MSNTLRDITKSELALLYAPNLTSHAAVNRLMKWLKKSPETMAALHDSGYEHRQKVFTPQQVGIIFDFLGEP